MLGSLVAMIFTARASFTTVRTMFSTMGFGEEERSGISDFHKPNDQKPHFLKYQFEDSLNNIYVNNLVAKSSQECWNSETGPITPTLILLQRLAIN